MSTITEISDVLKADLDAGFEAAAGVVAAIYPLKEGTTKTGKPYSVQNIMLRDRQEGSRQQIKVTLWNRDPMPNDCKGREVLLEAQEQNGLVLGDGSYVDKKTNNMVQGLVLVAQGSTLVSFAESAAPVREDQAPPGTVPAAPAAPPVESDPVEDGLKKSKRILIGSANALVLCLEAVDYIERVFHQKHPTAPLLTECARMDLVKCLSVMADRRGGWDGVPPVSLEKSTLSKPE